MQLFSVNEPQIVNSPRSSRKSPSVIRSFRVNRILVLLIALSLLVLGGVVAFACISGRYIRLSGRTYYLVQFSTHESLAEAQLYAEQNRQHGGAGYVLNDGLFRVMGACYLSEGEAIAVAEKQEDASVYKVEANAVRRPVIEEKTANAALKAAFATHEEVCSSIQTVLFSFDQGLQSESVLYKSVTNEIKTLKQQRERMEAYYAETARAEFKLVAENLAECSASLTNAAAGTSGTFSARVKYALIEILLQRTALAANFAA